SQAVRLHFPQPQVPPAEHLCGERAIASGIQLLECHAQDVPEFSEGPMSFGAVRDCIEWTRLGAIRKSGEEMTQMPIAYIDVPPGIRIDAKRKLVKEVFVALDEAYRVPDTRIFLREWPLENVSQDGRLDSAPAKPVAFLEVPPGIRLEVKRHM